MPFWVVVNEKQAALYWQGREGDFAIIPVADPRQIRANFGTGIHKLPESHLYKTGIGTSPPIDVSPKEKGREMYRDQEEYELSPMEDSASYLLGRVYAVLDIEIEDIPVDIRDSFEKNILLGVARLLRFGHGQLTQAAKDRLEFLFTKLGKPPEKLSTSEEILFWSGYYHERHSFLYRWSPRRPLGDDISSDSDLDGDESSDSEL